MLLRCCGGLCGGHFSTPGGHLSCVNQPWRPHCWDHPAPLLPGPSLPWEGVPGAGMGPLCPRFLPAELGVPQHEAAVVQAQPCPTKRPDGLWQCASKAKLIPRRKRSACSCPSNEWLGHNPVQRQAHTPALRKLPWHTREKTKMPRASEIMEDHNK